MNKKITLVGLALTLPLLLVGCGDKESSTAQPTSKSTTDQKAVPPTEDGSTQKLVALTQETQDIAGVLMKEYNEWYSANKEWPDGTWNDTTGKWELSPDMFAKYKADAKVIDVPEGVESIGHFLVNGSGSFDFRNKATGESFSLNVENDNINGIKTYVDNFSGDKGDSVKEGDEQPLTDDSSAAE